MPAIKENNNTWSANFYYDTWTGERKRKYKRGFETKKEALEWEREFLRKGTSSPEMKLNSLVALYMEDMSTRLKASTIENKKAMINTKLLPILGDMQVDQIKPTTIRKWQNGIINQGYAKTYLKTINNQGYAKTYLKTINNQVTAIFNYAVKYYDLKENPCDKAGSMGKKKADSMDFYTTEEFKTVIEKVHKPHIKMGLEILYWTGMRIGELLALTLNDIDFESKTITINKSYQRIAKEDHITEPKTPKSNRVVLIPEFLCNEIQEYIKSLYEISADERLFPFVRSLFNHELKAAANKADIKIIRLHDLRHSHASLLIELGFSPLIIAERLGHENIETTLETYSHLYPNKQAELIEKLELLRK